MSSLDFSRPSPVDGYYDVFLSFRGDDTRKGFTTDLYQALQHNQIHTFMDENLIGEEIVHLFEVIEKSRMAIVIYSENFASSDWCLRELETILQLWEDKKILVIPIFYEVDLKELKDITGKTATYFNERRVVKHDKNTTVVDQWEVAVRKLGGVSGISYKKIENRSEYAFRVHVIAIIKKKLLTVCQPTDEDHSIKLSPVMKQRPSNDPVESTYQASSSRNDTIEKATDAQSVDADKKHHRVTVTGYVNEEKVMKEVQKKTGNREEKLPYIQNILVAHPHVAGANDKKAPPRFVKNVPIGHADMTASSYERLFVLFSDENAQGCAIM